MPEQANNPAPIPALGVERYKKIAFLTGAGISAASGLATYRGEGGIWHTHNVEETGTKAAIEADPVKVWKAFHPMHLKVMNAQPNPAHHAITRLQQSMPPEAWVCVITQNVDGLHGEAGTTSILEAHGSLRRLRCTHCAAPAWPVDGHLPEEPPPCPHCGQHSRFDIVLFDESLDPMFALKALAFVGDCELFMAVGTSSLVAPASQLVEIAHEVDARTVLVDKNPMDERFVEHFAGGAEVLLPQLLRVNRHSS